MYSPFMDGFKVVGLGTCDRIVPDWGGILEDWSDYCSIEVD